VSHPQTLPIAPGGSSASPESYIGRVIAGRYALERLLGKGGMGLVFAARHVAVNRAVAVKVLRPEYARSDEAVARFHREAKAAAAVGSPHIVEVLDFGFSEEGGAYLTMELLVGEDLAELVRREGALDPARVVGIVRQVAAALAAAHARGIVHRDLKSGNVFVERGDRVKVLDFGVSKVLDAGDGAGHETLQGAVIGTAHYMAPEQASDGRNVDARADLYSLGCIAFELLTGELPFRGATPVEVLYKQAHESPRRPSALRSGIPRSLDALVLALLAKDRGARPRDARAVIDALDQWERRPARRRVVALAATAVLGIVAFALRPTTRPAMRRSSAVTPVRGEVRSLVTNPPPVDEPVRTVPSREVVATLVVQPEAARVSADGATLALRGGLAMVRASLGTALRLRAEAPGHATREETVVLTGDIALRWTLTPLSPVASRAEPAPRVARRAPSNAVAADAGEATGEAPPRLADGLHASPYRRDAGR
jgi:predicted Ser/Thr protein kinase